MRDRFCDPERSDIALLLAVLGLRTPPRLRNVISDRRSARARKQSRLPVMLSSSCLGSAAWKHGARRGT